MQIRSSSEEEKGKPPRLTPEEEAELEAMENEGDEPPLRPSGKVTVIGGKGIPQIKNGSMMKTAIISFIVTIIVIVGMGAMGGGSFVTKSDFSTNLSNIAITIEQSMADLGRLKDTINNAVQGMPSAISSQVTNSITQATNEIKTQLAGVASRLDTAIADGNSRGERLTELEDQVIALEAALAEKVKEEEEAVVVAEEDVAVVMGRSILHLLKQETPSGFAFLEITNASAQEVEITEIAIVLFPSVPGAQTYFTNLTIASTALMTWTSTPLGNDMFLVRGVPMQLLDGIKVDGGDEDTYQMTFRFTLELGKELPESGISLGIQINDFAYEVVI